MKYQKTLKWLLGLIGILALFAAGMGLFFDRPGEAFAYTNHRGETVTINAEGLYFYDTVSSAAQMEGNDFVTLTVGLPLLAVSAWYAFRDTLRGKLLLTGTVGFFLYTYLSMAMLASYNELFLIYVVLFSLSIFAFILCMLSFNLPDLPGSFSADLPRVQIAVLLFVIGGFLLLAWLGRIVPQLVAGETPVLENTTTLVIQAMDLGLIVPLSILAGVLLLRRNPWGYLLSSVALLKGATLGLGVSAMAINMTLNGVPDSLGIMLPFLMITAVTLYMAVVLLRNVRADS